MRQQQGNCCAICGKQPQRLNVDHDHKTGAVRELLCTNCNSLLGQCDDEISILQNAIAYIERHKRHAYIRA
ncbi:endonuclease domain-containing protein [Streptomyces europaeiscabiei]|uniref:endonuclease domain-containing protein n=1 Tax=Streptomyces europaeiscabiei TaxID=146819 RepID=UPI0038D4D7AA